MGVNLHFKSCLKLPEGFVLEKKIILKVDKEFSTFGYYLLFERNVVFHLIENN